MNFKEIENKVLRTKIFIMNMEAEIKILSDQKKSLLLKIKNKKAELLEEKRILKHWENDLKNVNLLAKHGNDCYCNNPDHELCWDGIDTFPNKDCLCCQNTLKE